MRALTVWQPWASLIVACCKPYEFRGWQAPAWAVGQRIAIHAGARPVRRGEVADLLVRLLGQEHWTTGLLRDPAIELLRRATLSPGMLPLGSILGTAVLGKPVNASQIVSVFGAPVNDSDREDHCNWAWPLTNIEPVVPPVPARGAQGFWNWTAMEAAHG